MNVRERIDQNVGVVVVKRRVRDERMIVTVPTGRLPTAAHITRARLTFISGAGPSRGVVNWDREVPLRIDLPIDVSVWADCTEHHFALRQDRRVVDMGPVAVRGPGVTTLALLFASEGVGEVQELWAHVDGVSQMLGGLHSVRVHLVEANGMVHGVVLLLLGWLLLLLRNLWLKSEGLDLLLGLMLLLEVLGSVVAENLEKLRVGHNILG